MIIIGKKSESLIFTHLLQGIYHIATEKNFNDYKPYYFIIPNNQKNFYDVIHRYSKSEKDVAFQYVESIKDNTFVMSLEKKEEGT